MNIEEMNLEQLETRRAEIESINAETYEGDIEELRKEMDTIEARKAELEEMEARKKNAEQLTKHEVEPQKVIKPIENEGRKNYGIGKD